MHRIYQRRAIERARFDKKLYFYLFGFAALTSTAALALAFGFLNLGEIGMSIGCLALGLGAGFQTYKCFKHILMLCDQIEALQV